MSFSRERVLTIILLGCMSCITVASLLFAAHVYTLSLRSTDLFSLRQQLGFAPFFRPVTIHTVNIDTQEMEVAMQIMGSGAPVITKARVLAQTQVEMHTYTKENDIVTGFGPRQYGALEDVRPGDVGYVRVRMNDEGELELLHIWIVR